MTSRLDAIRQREQAATEGPWNVGGGSSFMAQVVVKRMHRDDQNRRVTTFLAEAFDCRSPDAGVDPIANGTFIAHARTDVPMLLAVAEAAARVVADSEVVWDGGRGEWRWQTSDGRVPESVVALRAALAPLLETEA